MPSKRGAPAAPLREVLVIGDEDAARAATIAQMQLTAQRYGVGMRQALPNTAQPPNLPYPERPPQVIELPPDFGEIAASVDMDTRTLTGYGGPQHLPPNANLGGQDVRLRFADPPESSAPFLLLTTTRRGAKAVKMRGAASEETWPMDDAAATAAGLLLSSFGIRVVDLRDDDPDETEK